MSELNNNQENQDWGGKREGAGRPKGTKNKLNVLDFFNGMDLQEVMTKTIELAKTKEGSKERVFLLEQVFGKARQNLGIDGGEDGKALLIQISEAIANKNGINTSSEPNS